MAVALVTPTAAYESREAIVSQGCGAYWRRTASWARMTHYVMELNSGVVYHTQPADTVAWMWE